MAIVEGRFPLYEWALNELVLMPARVRTSSKYLAIVALLNGFPELYDKKKVSWFGKAFVYRLDAKL